MQRKKKGKNPTNLLVFAGFVFCLTVALFQKYELHALKLDNEHFQKRSLSEDTRLKENLAVVRNSPTLGFQNLWAGSTFLSFLQYFSDVSTQVNADKHLSPEFFEAIITFDPYYRDYYLFLSGSTTFHAAQPERSVELIARGLKQIDPTQVSDSFYIWRYKGSDELLFLGDSQSARESFEKAALWAHQSQDPHSELVGKASKQTAEFLRLDPDSRYAQISAWHSIWANAVNDEIKQEAAERIQELSSVDSDREEED